jgi:hypothetical protein
LQDNKGLWLWAPARGRGDGRYLAKLVACFVGSSSGESRNDLDYFVSSAKAPFQSAGGGLFS